MKAIITSTIFLFVYFTAFISYSQKGTGEADGVSYLGLDPIYLKISGTVEEIESGPCKYTNGKPVPGTHLLVSTREGMVNIHLGPTSEISQLFTGKVGDSITIAVFRTNKLPEDQYIAKELMVNGKMTVLRNEDLQPVWSTSNHKEKWRRGN